MKKLVGLVVLITALVLGGYYGMGLITERTVKHNLEAVNKSNGLTVKVVSYKRGLFKSHASLDWTLHVPERIIKTDEGKSEVIPAQDFEMQMPLTIYHGPIIFANKSIKFGLGFANADIPLPPKYIEQFNNSFTSDSTQPKLELSLFVSYLNHSQVEMSVPSFKLVSKEGGQFDWKGMTSSFSMNSHASKIKGELTFDGIGFQKDDTKFVMGEVLTEYDLHKIDSGLYLGDANISLPSMEVDKKNDKLFELVNFDLNSNCDVEGLLFSSHFNSSIEKIFADNKTYGPGKLEISIRNLDADVLARIHQEIRQAQQGPDADRQQALLAILPEVPKLLSRGAEFEISELSFAMPKGTIEGSLLVALPKGESSNPFELIQKVQGKGKLKIPADMIKLVLDESNKLKIISEAAPAATQSTQSTSAPSADTNAAASQTSAAASTTTQAPLAASQADTDKQVSLMTAAEINSMVSSGLLVASGDDFTIDIALDKGKLLVNGKPFNPAMFKF